MARRRGMTLWEMFIEKFRGPVEFRFYNPLRVKIGAGIMIDEVERRELHFFVKEIREYRRRIRYKTFKFVDYILLARPLGKDDVLVRLRVNPASDADRRGVEYQIILLELYDDLAYDKGLHDVVRDTTGKFEVLEDDVVQEEYWRIQDIHRPYKARVTVIKDTDLDKKAESSEIEIVKLDYWDYWREIEDAAKQPVNEFLFVEMDADDGWFQIWKGQEMDPRKVVVF